MDGQTELRLQGVDRTGPVDRRSDPFVGAVAQAFQPAGLDILVRKPSVDAVAIQPARGGDRPRWPALQQQVYFRAHSITQWRHLRLIVN